MRPLGLNRGGYLGETIEIDATLRQTLAAAHQGGWTIERLSVAPGVELPALSRSPSDPSQWAPRIYISAGIHGDEPAGPLAARELLHRDLIPRQAWIWLCPCLNPTGFPRNTRTCAEGLDLNRDYRHGTTAEVRAHIAWLHTLPLFDLALCLHEDWEAAGFYLYELNPANQPSLAPDILQAVADVCPIDRSPVIDGRDAHEGLIRPNLDPATRPEWPEAFFLIQHKTRLSYTLEAPSDFQLSARVAALTQGVTAAIRSFMGRKPDSPKDDGSPPPP